MKAYKNSKLTVLTPVYKNATSLKRLTELVFAVSEPLFAEVEYVLVNDGSPDNSREILRTLAQENPRIKVINFARNFGQHTALLAGLKVATGDFIFFIDGDLEENPKELPAFMAKIQDGFEVAVGVRSTKRHTLLKSILSRLYTKIQNSLADYKIDGNTSSMRLITRRYAEYLLLFSERPFIAGFTSWIGLPIGFVPIPWENQNRRSSYSWKKLFMHGHAGIIGFSTKLLRSSLVAGALISAGTFLYGFAILFNYFFFKHVLPGFTSIVLLISFLVGLQFIFIGILGEYLCEVFLSVKRRPEYLIYDTFNLNQ